MHAYGSYEELLIQTPRKSEGTLPHELVLNQINILSVVLAYHQALNQWNLSRNCPRHAATVVVIQGGQYT